LGTVGVFAGTVFSGITIMIMSRMRCIHGRYQPNRRRKYRHPANAECGQKHENCSEPVHYALIDGLARETKSPSIYAHQIPFAAARPF
jgi:hypothetical protein